MAMAQACNLMNIFTHTIKIHHKLLQDEKKIDWNCMMQPSWTRSFIEKVPEGEKTPNLEQIKVYLWKNKT